jgi:hypothetical protein
METETFLHLHFTNPEFLVISVSKDVLVGGVAFRWSLLSAITTPLSGERSGRLGVVGVLSASVRTQWRSTTL